MKNILSKLQEQEGAIKPKSPDLVESGRILTLSGRSFGNCVSVYCGLNMISLPTVPGKLILPPEVEHSLVGKPGLFQFRSMWHNMTYPSLQLWA